MCIQTTTNNKNVKVSSFSCFTKYHGCDWTQHCCSHIYIPASCCFSKYTRIYMSPSSTGKSNGVQYWIFIKAGRVFLQTEPWPPRWQVRYLVQCGVYVFFVSCRYIYWREFSEIQLLEQWNSSMLTILGAGRSMHNKWTNNSNTEYKVGTGKGLT